MKTILVTALLLFCYTVNAQTLTIPAGAFTAHMRLNESTSLPFRLEHTIKDKKSVLIIRNGAEQIELSMTKQIKDTSFFSFPNFDAELSVVATKGQQHFTGFWLNNNRTSPYKIAYSAKPLEVKSIDKATFNLNGTWDSRFDIHTNTPDSGVGLFTQIKDSVFGTILTETGDYRYLAGIAEGSHFYLSCFDGSHAFLLQAAVENSTLNGTFFSGKHYQTTWQATKNENAKLRDADSLTYIKPSAPFSFMLPDLNNKPYSFPNEETKNKVVIIQIMGTWCPNCMDETNFYKELYAKYHDRGLEIISVGYEAANDFAAQALKIQRMKERKQLNFQFLVGGKAQKSLASEHFSMLNEVISFPTSIYIGRDGKVKRVHTGFSGPGTGSYYTEYVEKTTALIEELLKM